MCTSQMYDKIINEPPNVVYILIKIYNIKIKDCTVGVVTEQPGTA